MPLRMCANQTINDHDDNNNKILTTEAEGLAELGVMEGELVPLVIPGTAVGFVNVRIVGNGVGKGGAVKK